MGIRGGAAAATRQRAHPCVRTYRDRPLALQSFPVPSMSEADGIKLALSMNEIELTQRPFGYGFGSYAFRNARLHFTAFLPNALYRPGMLPNIYFSSGQRARELAVHFTGCEWPL